MSWGDRFWAAVFGVAGLAVGLFLLHEGVQTLGDWLVFDDFERTTATIVSATPVARTTTSSQHGLPQQRTAWVAAVRYRYRWEGGVREGETDVAAGGSEAAARDAAAALPPGATADLFLDPADPGRVYFAAERPSLVTGLLLLGVGLFAVSLCVGLAVAAVRRRRGGGEAAARS